MLASLAPPFPPVEKALALPELPDVAVVSPAIAELDDDVVCDEQELPVESAQAVPVLPERAVLDASPPLAV